MQTSKSLIKKWIPKRDPWSHKGDSGRLVVIGGNKSYTGGPALTALAALHVGADLAELIAPRRCADIAATYSPDLITHPQRGDVLNSWHLRETGHILDHASAFVVGNGMGKRRETELYVRELLKKTKLPRVIDADGLFFLSKREMLVTPHTVLTPHSHEFFLLTDKHPTDKVVERQGMVERFAKKLGCTIVLKGHVDIISDGKQTAINKTGNPLMTKGGTGDILAGAVGGLLARGLSPFQAACAGTWISGTAGDMGAKRLGEGFSAERMLEYLPKTM